ncbi:putative ribonuclease H-like domain-containing protein, partial [Tanacetum coccineum]
FNQKSAAKTNNLNEKVKTAKVNNVTTAGTKAVVSAAKGNGENVVNSSVPVDEGIKREFSVARTPQQNGVAERKNRTLIEVARTMLADSLLPTTFGPETPYELLIGRSPNLDFMRPFGCSVTILNTLDHLGKFEGKTNEGFLVGYSINSKAFRVFNSRTKKVEENMHIKFLENKPNVAGSSPEWLFDIDSLTKSMYYKPVSTGNQTIETNVNELQTGQEKASNHEYILLPFLTSDSQGPKSSDDEFVDDARKKNDAYLSVSADGQSFNNNDIPTDPLMPDLEDSTGIFRGAYDDEDVGAEADLNNLETTMNVSLIPTTRIHKDHPKDQIIGDITSAIQTRRMINFSKENSMVSYISKQRRTNHKDCQNCLFAYFLSQIEPKKVIQALTDLSWIKAMQEELLQFKLQKVWTLVDLPKGKRAIGTKWVYRNKKDERGNVVRNKARLIDVKSAFLYGTIEEEVYVCQPPGFEDLQFPDKVYKVEKALYGLHQALRAWYKTLSTYLIENEFRRGTIDNTLFIKKDKGDILLVQVYVDDIIFGSTKKFLCDEFEQMMHKNFQMSSMGELTFFLGLQVQQKKDGIFISQDKYVVYILKKFDFITMKTTSTLTETNKALIKDEESENVDVHLYRSMIGSLMYLTTSRHDIMFAVCACARFQVTPKTSHLHAVKRIFRYLKGQPKLGLWYPRDSPFDLEAFLDSDYARASLDRKSITGAEYVAAANCCRQVLWIQNQMLDYGFNFMNTKIYIDNESTICIVKNPVFHSKTKHIEIRHHFIRDSYEKKLIQVIKIHTDHNVANLLTKAFDVISGLYIMDAYNGVQELPRLELKDKKELAILGQTAAGKEFSNPLMAGSLPKTIKSSVRNDLLFNDEDGITYLTNDDIFENLALIGYEQLSTKLTFQKEPQTELLQNETPPTVSYEPQTEANIMQILQSLSIYQRKHKKTQNHRRAKKVTELPQTSMPLDLGSDDAVHKEGVESTDDDLDEEDASKQGRTNDKTKPMFKDRALVSTARPTVSTARPSTSAAGTSTDAELAQLLHQEELAQVERRQREKAAQEKASIAALYKEKREQFTIKERAQFLVETIAAQRKFKAAQRATEIKSKPPTKTQLRDIMITYLKNIGKFNHNQLKGKSYEELQRLYEREYKWINDFVPMDFEKEEKKSVESESEGKEGKRIKRVADSTLKQKSSKKQKMMQEQESAKSDEDVTADYEHEKEELNVDMEYLHIYKIIRADGNTSYHKSLSSMLRKFDRQDLVDLHRLVIKRFEDTIPEGYNLLLWGDLKVMFEPNIEDENWSNQQDWTLISWKLYESCGVHTLLMDGTLTCFNMLVEKRYHLIKEMLQKMLNWKLEAKVESTMAFELLKFIKSQLD